MRRRNIPIYPHPRTRIWQLRRTIPTHLQRYFVQPNGKARRELSPVSLGTRDEKHAEREAASPWADHLAMLAALDRGRPNAGGAKRFFREVFQREDVEPDLQLSNEREAAIREAKRRIEHHELSIATLSDPAQLRRAELKLTMAKRGLLKLLEIQASERDRATEALRDISSPGSAVHVLDEYVDLFVARHPQPVDDTPIGRAVRSELREIAREEALAALARSTSTDAVDPALASPSKVTSHPNATDHSPSLTLQEYYDEVFRPERGLKTRRGEPGLSPSGMEKCLEGARDFTDVMGDMRLSSITPAHVREFKNTLLGVPRHWRKRVANAGKSLRKLIEEADASTVPVGRLSPETVNSTLTGLRQIFAFAVNNEHVQSNPVAGVTAERAKDKDVDPAFEIADLNKLFASPWFAGCSSDDDLRTSGDHLIRDHRFWAFLCMLFSGGRVAEIGGIHADQVHILSDTEGFFEFDWTEGEYGRRLKNASSVRVVPIHRELIRLGFIEYAKSIHAAGHERLFPGWIPQRRRIDDDLFKNEYSSSPFLKRFKTYLVWLGIKRPRLSIKSLRATWETATLGTDINERSLLKIAGRAQSGALSHYFPMKAKWQQLQPAVDQITFTGLEIDHLCQRAD